MIRSNPLHVRAARATPCDHAPCDATAHEPRHAIAASARAGETIARDVDQVSIVRGS